MAAADFTTPTAATSKTSVNRWVRGGFGEKGCKSSTVTITGPNTYKTGGSVLDLSNICPSKVAMVTPIMLLKTADKSDMYVGYYESTGNPKTGVVHLFKSAATAIAMPECGQIDLSGYSAVITVYGY